MKYFGSSASLACLGAATLLLAHLPRTMAHCDTLDGPVVVAAQQALAAGDVKLVLHWVQEADEPEIREAFRQAIAVRKLTPDAKALADRFFFETLVRVHRAGEGAPFTGLKPAGAAIPPAIAGADKSLERGDVSPLVKMLNEQVSDGVRARFKTAAHKKDFKTGDVAAGREYVKAYVDYIHYAEGIHTATESVPGHHSVTPEPHTVVHPEAALPEKTTHTH